METKPRLSWTNLKPDRIWITKQRSQTQKSKIILHHLHNHHIHSNCWYCHGSWRHLNSFQRNWRPMRSLSVSPASLCFLRQTRPDEGQTKEGDFLRQYRYILYHDSLRPLLHRVAVYLICVPIVYYISSLTTLFVWRLLRVILRRIVFIAFIFVLVYIVCKFVLLKFVFWKVDY